MYTVYNCKNYFSSDMLQMSLRGRECFAEKKKSKTKSSLEIICILNLDVKINVPPPSTKFQKRYIFPKEANVLNYKSKESLTFRNGFTKKCYKYSKWFNLLVKKTNILSFTWSKQIYG